MSVDKKSLHIRLFEAEDYPEQLAALGSLAISLMKDGFTDQAHRIMEVRADFVEYVFENELHTLLAEGIDGVKVAAEDRMQTKLRFKKLKMKKRKTKKKWLCCKKPRIKKRRRGGGRYWQSTCRYKNLRTKRIQVANMNLGDAKTTKKPKFVEIKGKRIKWCSGQAAK